MATFKLEMSPYHYPSPLAGYENAEPLSEERNADGKSLKNPSAPKSKAYDEFVDPIDKKNNGFDFHGTLLIINPRLSDNV